MEHDRREPGETAVPSSPRPGEQPGPRAADVAPPRADHEHADDEVSGSSGQSGSAGSSIGGAGP